MEISKRTIVLTGFGPFRNHPINASWAAVKSIKESNFENELNINLIVEELPVVYEDVSRIVPSLWEMHQPDVVIHVGVHGNNCIKIEKCAQKYGYCKTDVTNQVPECFECSGHDEHVLYSGFDCDKIINNIKSKCTNSLHVSEDAGRYLCEYTYYISLSKNPSTLFVHVPPMTPEYQNIQETTEQLKLIVIEVLKYLEEK